jgi:hypothetical protein
MTAHDEPTSGEAPQSLPVAQWLHDQVVPSLVAAGLRVELARSLCTPEAEAHLDHAARILDDLARLVRDEMTRRSGHSPSQ